MIRKKKERETYPEHSDDLDQLLEGSTKKSQKDHAKIHLEYSND